MIKVKQAIIVEGKYDKIRLSNLIDALIIPTNGFALYKDYETAELIKSLAKKTGIIILTDSDSAGLQIRNALRNIVREGEVINVFIPDIRGKERRKRTPSKQGLLGVEGIDDDTLMRAFERAGVFADNVTPKGEPITKSDLVELGLSGGKNSAAARAELQKKLGLPERLSANLLLEILNTMYKREEFFKIVSEIKA